MGNAADRIVLEPERRVITGRSDSSWRRDEKAGNAPRRIRIGVHAVGWRLSDLMEWVKSRQSSTPENVDAVAVGQIRGRKPSARKEG